MLTVGKCTIVPAQHFHPKKKERMKTKSSCNTLRSRLWIHHSSAPVEWTASNLQTVPVCVYLRSAWYLYPANPTSQLKVRFVFTLKCSNEEVSCLRAAAGRTLTEPLLWINHSVTHGRTARLLTMSRLGREKHSGYQFLTKKRALCQSPYLEKLSSNSAENQLIICSLEQEISQ